MKEIKLTRDQVALVDDEDYEYLSKFKWQCRPDGNTYYVSRGEYKNGKQIPIQMHREILGLTDPKIEGEHKDRNGLNNQRINLRIATRSQNCANRQAFKNSSSKYVGVIWFKKTKKWRARIQKDGMPKSLGLFNSEIDAAIAYNNAAIELHGEFANLNKITA